MVIGSIKKTISLVLALLIVMGGFMMLSPFAFAVEESYWNLNNQQYLGGTVKIRTYSLTEGEMAVTVDGTPLVGESGVALNGYNQYVFTLDTTKFTEYTVKTVNKKKIKQYVLHNILFTVDGAEIASASVYFDNTAPYIDSWEELDPFGKKYTKYDMSVWPGDVIILNTDKTFELSFNPTDDCSGVKSVTAELDNIPVDVPSDVEYDRLSIGFHTITYTLTDNLGNSDTQTYSFELRKPEPAYSKTSVTKTDSGYRLSSTLSGSFANYSAGFYLAEILPVAGYENVTKANDLDIEVPTGEKPLGNKTDGNYLTYTTTGGDIYQTYDINVANKVGMVYFDYAGETDVGNIAALEVYDYNLCKWKNIITKTAYQKSFKLSAGKKGIQISDYVSDKGILKIRVRLISGRTSKYLKTTYVCPSVRFNSLIETLKTGSNGTAASVVYTGNVTASLGWYIRGEAEYYYSYSPTYTFDVTASQSVELEQYNCVFNGETSTRASITWQTSVKTNTNVQIMPYTGILPDFYSSTSYTGSTAFNDITGKYSHKVKLTGLKPNSKYWIRYGDSSKGLWSEPCIVETPSDDNCFSFIAGSTDTNYNAAKDNLNIAKWNNCLDFIVTLGNEASGEEEWNAYFKQLSSLFENVRVMPVAGSKDSNVWWSKYGLAEQSGAGHANGVYYSIQYKNALFLVINSNDVSATGTINKTQQRWIEKILSGYSGDWKFVVLNSPLTGENIESNPLEAQLCPLFDEYDVNFVISSGKNALNGDLGEETIEVENEKYYSASDVLYINADCLSAGYTSFEVNEYLVKYTDIFGNTLNVFSDGRFKAVEKLIDALPNAANISLNDKQKIDDVSVAYDELDEQLALRFVTNKDKLDLAKQTIADIILTTPPEIAVSAELPKKAVIGSEISFPKATATDYSDGDVSVDVAAFDPEGNVVGSKESVVFEDYGIYRIVYSSKDTDGNISNAEFSVKVLPYTLGDVDNNGFINSIDALLSLRFVLFLKVPDSWDIAVSDMNSDNEITITDSLDILRISANNI